MAKRDCCLWRMIAVGMVAVGDGLSFELLRNTNNNNQPTKRTSKGKQKIEIKKIENKTTRQVTFTKRRNGLFSKCKDLYSQFNAEVAVITFSIAGKPVAAGYPSVDSVLQRYINVESWDKPIDNMGLEELERFKESLEGLRDEINSRVIKINLANDGEIIRNNNNNVDDFRVLEIIPHDGTNGENSGLNRVNDASNNNNVDDFRVLEIIPYEATNGEMISGVNGANDAINGDKYSDYLELMDLYPELMNDNGSSSSFLDMIGYCTTARCD